MSDTSEEQLFGPHPNKKRVTRRMIRISNLTKEFLLTNGQNLRVLDDINLTLPSNKSVAIVGQSGSGKSTLLSLLTGLDAATTGNIELDGTLITKLNETELSRYRAQNIGIVFQNFQLMKHFSALSNISLAAQLADVANPNQRALEELKNVGLEDRASHKPGQLSGGECQRIAIARAMVANPKFLFCDEPTGNLDQNTAAKIVDLLWTMKDKYKSNLIIVTHDPSFAQKCDIVVTLSKGKVTNIEEKVS